MSRMVSIGLSRPLHTCTWMDSQKPAHWPMYSLRLSACVSERTVGTAQEGDLDTRHLITHSAQKFSTRARKPNSAAVLYIRFSLSSKPTFCTISHAECGVPESESSSTRFRPCNMAISSCKPSSGRSISNSSAASGSKNAEKTSSASASPSPVTTQQSGSHN